MSQYFKHDYIIPDEFRADATILCMRCGIVIASPSYRTMKKKNAPNTEVYVYDRKLHSHYRTANLRVECDGKVGNMVIAVCADCLNFELDDEEKASIMDQICRAIEIQYAKDGLSPTAARKAIENMKAQKIVGHQEV